MSQEQQSNEVLFFPDGREWRSLPDDETKSVIWDDPSLRVVVQRRYIEVSVTAKDRRRVCVRPRVVEEAFLYTGKGTRSDPGRAHELTIKGAPSGTVEWDLFADKGYEGIHAVAAGCALAADECHGATKEEFAYGLLWASLRKSAPLREWAAKNFPRWWAACREDLEKAKVDGD